MTTKEETEQIKCYQRIYSEKARFSFDDRPLWIRDPSSVPVKEKQLIDSLIIKIEKGRGQVILRYVTQLEKKLKSREDSRHLDNWLDMDARVPGDTFEAMERVVEREYDSQIKERLEKYTSKEVLE